MVNLIAGGSGSPVHLKPDFPEKYGGKRVVRNSDLIR